jgi:hypothetical protein
MKTLQQVFLSLLLSMVAPQASQAQFLCTTNAGNTITITGYSDIVGALQIPGTLNGFPVTSIGDGAFWGRFELTNVTMLDGITNIGVGAFSYCGMTSIMIPSSVIGMGLNAFGGCGSLTNVVLPLSLTKIPEFAFGECFHLSTIVIPTNVASIETSAFDRSGLVSVSIPGSVTNIGTGAFSECSGLTNVVISDGVVTIGDAAFYFCPGLTAITIPRTVTSIGSDAFGSCNALTNVTLGGGITNIGDYAFANTGLTTITFPSKVSYLGDHAFDYCDHLDGIFFCGDAPGIGGPYVFAWNPSDPLHYLPGTSRWTDMLGMRPTTLWLPLLQPVRGSLGIQTNQFGLQVNWAAGQTVVVEASVNMKEWQPILTNILTTCPAYFSDPQWTNYSSRFYRLYSQ